MHSVQGLCCLRVCASTQASYLYLQPHCLEALEARITAEMLANPPLYYEPEEAAAKAAAEAVREAQDAAAQAGLFDAMVPLDPQVCWVCMLGLRALSVAVFSAMCS